MNSFLTGRFAPIFLFGFTLLMLLPGTGTLPLLDRDEPRFATASREMIERNDWVVPTFNGHDRFDKPALSYWLMRGGYALFGQNEFGARFPNVLCAAALVLVVWWLGRQWFGAYVAWLAALGLATCLQLFIHGRLALADLPMVLAITVIQLALAALLFPANRIWRPSLTPPSAEGTAADHHDARGWWWALWLSVAVGFLAKGPITLAVPLVSLLLLRFVFWRQPLPWHRLAAGRGALLALALIALWGIPALIETEGRFFAVGIGEHVVKRGYDKFNGRSYNPFFYLTTAPLSLFPWIVFAPLAWFALKTRDIRHRWLASWLTAPYLIFTFYATQLPHYVLPAFPAFFLLLGEGLSAPRPAWRRGGFIALTILAILFLLALGLLAFRPLPASAEMLRPAFFGVLIVVLSLVGLAAGIAAGAKWQRAGLLVGGLGVVAGSTLMALGLRSASLSIALPTRWTDAPAETRFIGAGFTEPSLVFYSHRLWLNDLTPEEFAQEVAKPGPLVVVSVDRQIDPIHLLTGLDRWRIQAAPPSAVTQPGWTRQTLTGFNPGRTRWQELSVWRRD